MAPSLNGWVACCTLTSMLSGFGPLLCGLWLALGCAIASRPGGAHRLGVGDGLLLTFSKQLFFGFKPKFEILAKRTMSLLPEMVGQLAG